MKQKSVTQTPRLLQALFVAGIVVFYVAQLAFSLFIYIQGMQTNVNQDFATYNFVGLLQGFIPLVLAVIVLLTRRDRRISLNSVFFSLLLTLSAMLFMVALGQIMSLVNMFSLMPAVGGASSSFWWYTLLSVAVPLVIVICGLMLVILHLRRQKQW